MNKNKQDYNAYMKKYMLARYHKRRQELINTLGRQCHKCGNTQDLEIDHKDPKLKSSDIGKMIAGYSEEKLKEEYKKCQILCTKCHNLKSITERGFKPAIGTHGTLSAYRYCKCPECKKAKADYMRNYRTGS